MPSVIITSEVIDCRDIRTESPASYVEAYAADLEAVSTDFTPLAELRGLVDTQFLLKYQDPTIVLACAPSSDLNRNTPIQLITQPNDIWEFDPHTNKFLSNFLLLRHFADNNLGVPKFLRKYGGVNEQNIRELSDYYSREIEAAQNSEGRGEELSRNLAVTAILPSLETGNSQKLTRRISADTVAKISQLNSEQRIRITTPGRSLKRGLISFINRVMGKKQSTIAISPLKDGQSAQQVLKQAKCLEGQTLAGIGNENYYFMVSEALQRGLNYCIQSECPLLKAGCVRAELLNKGKHNDYDFPNIEAALDNFIERKRQIK